MPRQTVTVPDIGGAEAAEVIEVLVAVGDEVAVDQGLIVLESDKASMEIPSTLAGTVVELLVSQGQQLAEGAAVAIIEMAGAAAQDTTPPAEPRRAPVPAPATAPADIAQQPAPAHAAAAPQPQAMPAEAESAPDERGGVYAGPAVRKLAREFGVSLQQVSGSGPRGRVVKEDLQQFVQRALGDRPAGVGTGSPFQW